MFLKAYYKIFLTYLWVFLFVVLWVYTVFSTDIFFDAKINNVSALSKSVYLDDNQLSKNIIVYESSNDLSNYKMHAFCKSKIKYLWNKDDKYFFSIQLLNKNCNRWLFYLKKENSIIKNSFYTFQIFSKAKLFDLFSNFDTQKLIDLKTKILKELSKENTNIDKWENLKETRKKQELKFNLDLINKILKQRQKKYISAVKWYKISRQKNKIPNAWRPYRADYTDWIHHWWDIPAPAWTKTRALAYGEIIRIVDNFKFSDLDKIKRKNLSFDDKTINLDILRGNQVWLKTANGDVVFYSHLQNIPKWLKVGDLVEAGTFLWEVWISGVPDKHYKDIHLHLPIMKNPRNKKDYSFLDIMKWDWYFKWKLLEYVLEHQNELFTNE